MHSHSNLCYIIKIKYHLNHTLAAYCRPLTGHLLLGADKASELTRFDVILYTLSTTGNWTHNPGCAGALLCRGCCTVHGVHVWSPARLFESSVMIKARTRESSGFLTLTGCRLSKHKSWFTESPRRFFRSVTSARSSPHRVIGERNETRTAAAGYSTLSILHSNERNKLNTTDSRAFWS